MVKRKRRCLFGEVLASLMKSRNITQVDLASKTGISQPTIAWYLSCRKLPNVKKGSPLPKIAQSLNLSKEEKKKLYISRFVIRKDMPLWKEETLNLLPKGRDISREQAVSLFDKGLGGIPLTTWALRWSIHDATAQKVYNFLKTGENPPEIATMRRTVLPQIIEHLQLSEEEKASLLRFFFKELVDPDIYKTLIEET